jgi:hypothetical protein
MINYCLLLQTDYFHHAKIFVPKNQCDLKAGKFKLQTRQQWNECLEKLNLNGVPTRNAIGIDCRHCCCHYKLKMVKKKSFLSSFLKFRNTFSAQAIANVST